jgi:hypoxanthine phosphoribosyltransferase
MTRALHVQKGAAMPNGAKPKTIKRPEPLIKNETLSYADIEHGLSILVDYTREYGPNFIFGINRGGAIVGGMLLKQLDDGDKTKNLVPNIILLHVNKDTQPHVIEQRHDAAAPLKYPHPLTMEDLSNTSTRAKALLVDDIGKTGSHMTLAYEHLKQHHPSLEVKRMVMLRTDIHARGPYSHDKLNPHYDIFPFFTHNNAVLLPWDRQKPALKSK